MYFLDPSTYSLKQRRLPRWLKGYSIRLAWERLGIEPQTNKQTNNQTNNQTKKHTVELI